jgi:acetate CoA/acetoacetate CoA-transferase alpha subunit
MKTISVQDAVALIPNGSSLMIGGFMGVGTPERLVEELVRQGRRDLVVIANDTAVPGKGIGRLVSAGLVRKTIASHIGLNPQTQQQMLAGTMAVDLVPQGTLIERIRAGGSGSVVFSRQPASVPLSRRGSERSKSPTKCIS